MTVVYSTLSTATVERVLTRLGISRRPQPDLDGLNELYTAWCGAVPFDNVRKRIWFASDRSVPLPGGGATDFFENWLLHGTGGTCWPGNGALFALVDALGFDARRIAGAMIDSPGPPDRAGHGSVVVTLDGIDYLVDASILSFEALPLVPGAPATAGPGIHQIRAAWTETEADSTATGVDVIWLTGHARDTPIHFRPSPEFDRVDHAFFLDGYERSKHSGPFNRALRVCRRYPDSIVTIHRNELTTVAADGSVSKCALSASERTGVLLDQLHYSEESIQNLPPDELVEA